LRAASQSIGGTVGIAAVHVETGRVVEVKGRSPLPLYSVFKLPLAVAILNDVDEGRLRLDQKVKVGAAEIVPGSAENASLWPGATERTLREMLELSIGRSDNTSADKLLELAGGPGALTRRLSALGIQGVTIRKSVREFLADRAHPHPNTASALDLARLLVRLQKGEILKAASRDRCSASWPGPARAGSGSAPESPRGPPSVTRRGAGRAAPPRTTSGSSPSPMGAIWPCPCWSPDPSGRSRTRRG
jgi:beta-lactamase class A